MKTTLFFDTETTGLPVNMDSSGQSWKNFTWSYLAKNCKKHMMRWLTSQPRQNVILNLKKGGYSHE